MPRPQQSTVTVSQQITNHQCDYCEKLFRAYNDCARHEWEQHITHLCEHYSEYYYDTEFQFINFPDQSVFDTFCVVNCALAQDWEGPGWYRTFTYRDTCRGCDMGETTGLEFVGADPPKSWITQKQRVAAMQLEIQFGEDIRSHSPDNMWLNSQEAMVLGMSQGPFVHWWNVGDQRWEIKRLVIKEKSIEIIYAAPTDSSYSDEQVYLAWRIWKSDNER